MIMIAGGTGRLGQQVVRLLVARGLQVRVLTREPSRAKHLLQNDVQAGLVEVMTGDVRDPEAVKRAMSGVQSAISAVHGFAGTGADNPQSVDWHANVSLMREAQSAGIEHFILMSIHGAAPDHRTELFRMKYLAEEELRASTLSWTIIRPTAYIETWAQLVGEPLLKKGKTTLFGRGDNPINFVSVSDVASFVELAVVDPELRGKVVEVGGPQNLSMNQFADTFEQVTGKAGKISHIPLPMMRIMSVLMKPLNPTVARQIGSGVIMDTKKMSFDATESRRPYPTVPLTSLTGVIKRDYVSG
ncbi:MAG: SDR family oxidoreductase [Chloroflexi bacterium]|nr:SDR family oxidoreductase [Chloroflexota bacterium]